MMQPNFLIIISILLTGMILSVTMHKLTVSAALTGGLLGFFIYAGIGYAGIIMMAIFFIMGTLATQFKIELKQNSGIAEMNKGQRTTGQVIANAGVAAILSLLSYRLPQYENLFVVLIASCFAGATADTVSSELGNLYGKRFYNIYTFKKDERGLNGVVSFEGTLYGVAGSTIIAAVYAIIVALNTNVIIIILAATIGNFADSFLGATLERKHYIGNNAVNFLNTFIASLSAYFLYMLF